MMLNNDAIDCILTLAEVQAKLLRRLEDCGEPQFTDWGICGPCKNFQLCRKLDLIIKYRKE